MEISNQGETGNVDTMLSGIAATTDDGNVKVIINYEDENGPAGRTSGKRTDFIG